MGRMLSLSERQQWCAAFLLPSVVVLSLLYSHEDLRFLTQYNFAAEISRSGISLNFLPFCSFSRTIAIMPSLFCHISFTQETCWLPPHEKWTCFRVRSNGEVAQNRCCWPKLERENWLRNAKPLNQNRFFWYNRLTKKSTWYNMMQLNFPVFYYAL
jgi:hypothetical protein